VILSNYERHLAGGGFVLISCELHVISIKGERLDIRSLTMKFLYRGVFYVVLLLAMIAATLQTAAPVEAGSNVDHAIVPARFFSLLQAADQKANPNAEIPLPDGPGRDTTKRVCTTCHGSNVWASKRHTRDEWSAVIDNMISKGLTASDDELAEINTYLAKSFPPLPKKDDPAPKP
jgi:cytochrome c5